MSTINLDYIYDLINTCSNGDLLITYYRDYDVELERIKELFEYIDEHKSTDYNWVKVDVTNCQEECISHCIFPPCTIWYDAGIRRCCFTSYDNGSTIVNRIKKYNEYNAMVYECRDDDIYYPINTSESEIDYDVYHI